MSEHYTLHGERKVWNRKRFRSPDNSAGEDEDNHTRDNPNRQETRKGSEPNLTLNHKLNSTRKSMVSFRDQQLAREFDQHEISKAGDNANNMDNPDFQMGDTVLGGGMRMDTLEDPSQRSLSMKLKRSVYRSEKAVKQRDFDYSKTGHRIGEWVDVLGEQNIWRDGQVLGKDRGRLLVLYHESGADKEEWLPDNSPRIAFFKTHTTGVENAYYMSPVPQKPVRIRLETSSGHTSISYLVQLTELKSPKSIYPLVHKLTRILTFWLQLISANHPAPIILESYLVTSLPISQLLHINLITTPSNPRKQPHPAGH